MPGKAHKPDLNTRGLVSALALNGVIQSRIAEHAGISEPSLRKHYRRELDFATDLVCARVAKNLVRIASTGSGNAAVQAAKYVLDAKGRWKDIGRLEIEPGAGAVACFAESASAGVRERILARIAAINGPPDPDPREAYKEPAEPSDAKRKTIGLAIETSLIPNKTVQIVTAWIIRLMATEPYERFETASRHLSFSASSDVGLQPVMCWHRLNRLVHLSHELRKPIGGDEHVVDLRVVNPLDRPGLDALQDFTDRRERREALRPR
jgi:hypothetical protein